MSVFEKWAKLLCFILCVCSIVFMRASLPKNLLKLLLLIADSLLSSRLTYILTVLARMVDCDAICFREHYFLDDDLFNRFVRIALLGKRGNGKFNEA